MTRVAGLHWQADGQPQGDPLLLCSGLDGTAGFWDPNVAALGAEARLFRYDHRGVGRSDRALDGVVTVDGMAADVVQLLDGLGIERVSFVGHGLGGLIGLVLALTAPQRLANLIVVNGWASPDPNLARSLDVQAAMLRDTGARACVRAMPLFLYPAAWTSENIARIDAAEDAAVDAFPSSDAFSKRAAAVRRADIAARLGEIEMPVLLIAAEDDMLVPADCSRRLAAGLRDAELKMLPRGGHACNVTMPHVVETFVSGWLNRIRRI